MTLFFEGKWTASHFMDTFLPWPGNKRQNIASPRNFSCVLQRGERNTKLIEALNRPVARGELVFVKGDQIGHGPDRFRPTICGLQSTRAPVPEKEDCYNAVELFIEPTLASQEVPKAEVLARVTSYVSKVFNHQHRIHLFSIHIDDNRIRFARWDRAAIIASGVCEFKSKTLAEFLQRFHLLSPQCQGRDNTAQIASAIEKLLLETGITRFKDKHAQVRPVPKGMVETSEEYPTYKLRANHPFQERVKEYIVQKPFFMRDPLIDRATRGYVAWGVSEKRLVFVKDSWAKIRNEMQDLVSESTALFILNNNNIPHVPKFFAFGDVLGEDGQPQIALNQRYAEVCNNDNDMVHYRVAQTLAFPLWFARRSRDVVSAFRNALCAMEQAHKKAMLHHSDISLGNIMLDCDTCEGLLIDWDNALVTPHTKFSIGPGTDPFRSIWSTLGGGHVHRIQDDVESCFWALLEATLSWYAPYYQAARTLKSDPLNDWYADLLSGSGRKLAMKKLNLLLGATLTNIEFSNPNLNVVFHAFAEKIRQLYRIPGQTLTDIPAKTALKMLQAYKAKDPMALQLVEQELADVRPIIQIFDDALERSGWPELELPTGQQEFPIFIPPDQPRPEEPPFTRHDNGPAQQAEAPEIPQPGHVRKEGRSDKGKKRARPSDVDDQAVQVPKPTKRIRVAKLGAKKGGKIEGRNRRKNVQEQQSVTNSNRNSAKKARLKEIEGKDKEPPYEGRMTRSRTKNARNVNAS